MGFLSGLMNPMSMFGGGGGGGNPLSGLMGGGGGSPFGGGSSPPPPIDYAALIPQQQAANTAQFNQALDASRVNSTGPNGSQTWSQGPDGRWVQNTTLNPTQQKTYDAQQQQSLGLANTANSMLPKVQANFNQPVPQYQQAQYDPSVRQKASDALYAQQTRYLDPQVQNAQHDLRNDLVAQGFSSDSDAYRRAQTTQDNQVQQAYGAARDSAIAGGTAQATQDLQNQLATNNANFQGGLMSRAVPMNEFNALRTGAQVNMPNSPATQTPPQALQGTDLLGANQQSFLAQLAASNAKNANSTNNMNGLMGMANAGIGLYGMMK